MSEQLTHFDQDGKAIMVDISSKQATRRQAVAAAEVRMKPQTLAAILDQSIQKGDVFGVARLAGIMAAKQTAGLIPLCHPLALTAVEVDFNTDPAAGIVSIRATASVTGQTGVEMEALTAASVAGLTIYDMCKAIDKEMVIGQICLLKKTGGKSGTFERHC
ncbi:MAG: cyclic pyranopterin monophosphate synthase MoaC [Pelovirga sp.]